MIYYRMSESPSQNKPPKYADDKFRVCKTCFKTFVGAFLDIEPQIHFIFDRCGGHYLEMVKELWPIPFTHEFSGYGHYNSQLKVYNLAQECKDEIIVFHEDDYLWREGMGKYFMSVIKELGIVSPYDHPDFYTTEPRRSRQEKIKVINNWHWRTIQDTTMTFGITKHKFMFYRKTFDDWGSNDTLLWAEAKDIIWCPIPSLATHFVEGKLAPSVDWIKYYGG